MKRTAKLNKKTPSVKTMTFSEFKRLSFCNSRRLPRKVVIGGTVRQWVGMGWVELDDKPTRSMVVIVDD